MISSSLPHFSGDISAFLNDLEALSHRKPASDFSWLQRTNAPIEDLFPTLLSWRACILGLKKGKSFYHHELRRRIAMPPELEPSLSVWEHGTTPVWENGVLQEPKYFSFFQEAPIACFNPCHRTKWRAHELLHGAIGFFWSPEITRFEAYLCARINELLPVIHWYDFDEIYRHRCKEHNPVCRLQPTRDNVRRQAIPELCPKCEKESRPFWEVEITPLMHEQAALLLQNGLAHWWNEMAVIREEIDTLKSISSPRGNIDGSSDAIGYVESHWNRMTAWSFGGWMERYMDPDIDYHKSIEDLLVNSESVFEQLLGGNISLGEDEFTWARNRRIAQDIGYRCLLALEWLDPEQQQTQEAEAILEPLMEECDQVVETGQIPSHFWTHFDETAAAVAQYLPEEVQQAFPCLGISEQPTPHGSYLNVMEGLSTGLPGLFKVVEELPVEQFCHSPQFFATGQLAERFYNYIKDLDDFPELPKEVTRFETWISAWPHKDADGEIFGALPEIEELEKTLALPREERAKILRLNSSFRIDHFNGKYLVEILGDYPENAHLLAYYWRKELLILEVTDKNLKLINALGVKSENLDEVSNLTHEDHLNLLELIDIGLFVYTPAVDRSC